MCVTKHAFQGNPSERQVSFSAGERVIYDTAHNEKATQGGWVWVKLVSNPAESSGWCPQAYLTVPNEPPFTVTTNRAKNDVTNDDDGFSGSIMGGSSTNNPSQESIPFAVATPVETTTTTTTTTATFATTTPVATPPMATATVQGNNRVAGAFRNFGSNVQQAGQRSWRAVSNGAQTAGKAISNGAQTAGKAIQEGAQGLQQKQQTMSNKPPEKRTEGEQRVVNIGNYAARGAVVNGIYNGIMSGGNPKAAVRGATRGAVRGGTWGAVAGWKPFG